MGIHHEIEGNEYLGNWCNHCDEYEMPGNRHMGCVCRERFDKCPNETFGMSDDEYIEWRKLRDMASNQVRAE